MATKYWTGTDGDLDVAGNWSTTGVPGAGDDVIFDGRSTGDVSSNLDVWATTNLGSLTVWSGYTGDIGSSGSTPLQMECNAGEVYLAGTGTTYLQCAAAADGSILKCIINSAGTVYLSSEDNGNADADVYTTVQIIKGTVYVLGESENSGVSGHLGESGTAITTLKITPTGTATVRIGDQCVNFKGTDRPMDVIIDGGTLTAHSALGDIQQMGGTLNYGSTDIDMDGSDDDITSLTVSGGTFYWKPQNSGSISTNPTIDTLDVIAGTFNGASMENTLAAGVDPVVDTTWQYGGTVDLRNIYANFDFTTYYT